MQVVSVSGRMGALPPKARHGRLERMFGSHGFSNVAIPTAVGTTGVWIMAFKLELPIVAVVLVVLAGQSTAGAVGAALVGVLVIAVFGLVLWLVFRSDASAHRLGHLRHRALNWVLHFRHNPASDRVERAVLHFRDQANQTVHERGWLLTGTVLASQMTVLVSALPETRPGPGNEAALAWSSTGRQTAATRRGDLTERPLVRRGPLAHK